jgi:hypothetical protein
MVGVTARSLPNNGPHPIVRRKGRNQDAAARLTMTGGTVTQWFKKEATLDKTKPLAGMRKVIAERMSVSWNEKPVIQNGQIVVRPMCNCVLGFDHRLVDGAVGAKFMARFRELMENPLLLLVG